MKILIKVVAILMLLSSPCWAVNTATRTGNTVSVVLDGSTNFDLATVSGSPSPVQLEAIVFKPSAANDYIQVRDVSASGAIIWPANVDVLGGGQVIYFGGLARKPYIVAAECHFGTAANALVTFIYRNR